MRKVRIKMSSWQQRPGEEVSGGSWETSGSYQRQEDSYYLSYQEPPETGLAARTEIRGQGGRLSLRRQGEVEMEQHFGRGQSCRGSYRTPYGLMQMETRTLLTEVNLTDTGGNIKLKYELFLAGEYIGIHWLEISFQAE